MQDLINCSRNLTVLIQTEFKDWSFIYDIVKTVDIDISNTTHSHPIPYGTQITDHVMREMDTIKISGIIGCVRCGNRDLTMNNVIPELKRLSERMMYCKEDFITLTSNDWQARHMILTGVTVSESQETVQTKLITTTWVGANTVGSIANPSFERGGIIH